MTWHALLGTALAVVGLYLLSPAQTFETNQNAHIDRVGVFAAIGAAVMWAISTTMMKVGLQDGANVIAINSFRLPLGGLVLALMLWRWRGRAAWDALSGAKFSELIALSLYGTGFGSILWILSIDYAGAARSALVNSMAPLMGVPLAIVFLREHVTWKIGLGTCLAMAGVGLVL